MGEEPAAPDHALVEDRLSASPEFLRERLRPLAEVSIAIDQETQRVQDLQAELAEAKRHRDALIGRRGQLVRELHADGVPLTSMQAPTGLGPARINQLKRGTRT